MAAESQTVIKPSNVIEKEGGLKWYKKPKAAFVSRLVGRDVPLAVLGTGSVVVNLLARNTAAKLQQGAELAQNTSIEIIESVTTQIMDPANIVSIVAGVAMAGTGFIFGMADAMRYGSEREIIQQ